MRPAEKIDRAQRHSKPAGVAVATFKKFSEDRSTNLGAMISFWGIFSTFPLFLVLVTCLAWFLPAGDKQSVLGNVARMLPLLDPSSVSGLSGSWWVFVLGLLTALWSGIGVVRTVQFAFDSVWGLGDNERPGLVHDAGVRVRRHLGQRCPSRGGRASGRICAVRGTRHRDLPRSSGS
jgi:membrane protein